ncbi:PAS domain S-box protein [Desulfococcaceae bacterium HSG9]|nr:PAS domain S-box protein [Desulfococcaceae bacterium HSG9]
MSIKSQKINEDSDWRFRVFDSLSFPTLILKKNKEIISANKKFLELFQVSGGDLIGKKCYDYFKQSDFPCTPDGCPIQKMIENKNGCSILNEVKEDGKRVIWEERVFSPILNDKGDVAYIMESVRDATRIKTLEKRLTGMTELMRNVIHSSVSAIVAVSKDGVIMNKAAEDLFGYTAEEIDPTKGKKAVDLYPAGVAKEIMGKLRSPLYGGKGKLSSTEVNIINASGEEVPVRMTAAIIYEDGLEVGSMGVYNDLRERQEVEKKLKDVEMRALHSEKMASLGQLAAGVAHEINNPLTGIMLYADMLLENMDDDDRKEDIKYILEDANRCKEIVKNLLMYSRQTSLKKEIILINDLLNQSLALIRDQEIFMNIAIKKNLSQVMMIVQVDKNQMHRVIINLVINAIDAMDKNGNLTFRTYRNKDKKKVYLEITDTGSGIDNENIVRIFDPFFTTKELGKGTGLGLSTVYGIIKKNSGRISVKETSPHGTTFLIELPLYIPGKDDEMISQIGC